MNHGLSRYTSRKCRCDVCRSAWRAYQQQYRQAHREQYLSDGRAKYADHAKRAQEFLGGRCARCGTITDLEFDHIDPRSKRANITSLLRLSWATIAAELEKCQLLCASCHVKKTSLEWARKATHGTSARYDRGCRCKACASAHSAQIRRWHTKSKVAS